VKFVVKEWQFSDGSHSLNSLRSNSQRSLIGSSSLLSKTGRKLKITVVEAKDLAAKDKSEKINPYIKLLYGKVSVTGFLLDSEYFHINRLTEVSATFIER